MSWLHDMTTEFLEQVQEAKDKKVFPFFRPFQNLGPRVKIGRRSYINFTSNDYLGLSQDKRLIQSAVEGIELYGTGLGSARLQATSDKHELLEERIEGAALMRICLFHHGGPHFFDCCHLFHRSFARSRKRERANGHARCC